MKTVFNNHREVCHVWASQQQPHGRGSRIFFEGPSIFSYGHHFEMARFIRPDLVLITNRTYSVSTSKHLSYMRRAIGDHIRTYTVPSFTDHAGNLAYFIHEAKAKYQKAQRARSYAAMHLRDAQALADAAIHYMKDFPGYFSKTDKATRAGIRLIQRDKFFCPEMVQTLITKTEQAQKEREAQRALQRERAIEEEQEKLAQWKQGENINRYFETTALRLKDNEVETTHGARVPIIDAKKLYRALKEGLNIVGQRVGHFEVRSLTETTITIGCHLIPLAEIERIAPAVMAYKTTPKVCEDCLGIDTHEPNCLRQTEVQSR